MIITVSNYYKAIILLVGALETTIIEEKHFATESEALAFTKQYNSPDYLHIVLAM